MTSFAALLAGALWLGLAGCGGSKTREAATQIPSADRIAYYQLAITSGLLRSSAVAAARSQPTPPRAGASELRAARTRLAQLKPRDAGLKEVLLRISPLLGEARPALGRAAAHRVLARLNRINRILERYLARHPEQAALIPE